MIEMAQTELPKDWVLKPIGEIVQPIRPKISPSEKPDLPFLGMDHIEANTMRQLGSVPAGTMKSSAVHFQPGDVLYGRLRPYLNKVFQPHFEGLCSAEFIVFPESDELDNKYFQYFLNSSRFVRHATSLNSGDRPRVKFEQFAPYCIPLPPTVEDQKHIVAKIEELFSHIDAGIEALKKAKQLLKQYRQSVLKAAVTGELTKEWREQNNLSKESWQESTIGEIASVQTGKTPKRSTEEFWKSGAIPWLTSSATNEEFTHHAEQFVTQEAVDSGLRIFEPGTLLLAMYGEGKTRGQVTEITFQATCNQACAAIIVDEDKVSRAFVRLRLYENYEQTRKAASGGNQPNLNLSKVREISLPLPPLSEQAGIISQVEQKFEAINRLENELEKLAVKAEKNKQTVLAAAFSGRLLAEAGHHESQSRIMIGAEA